MLFFIIPFRDRSATTDWPGTCRRLERTLASACGQIHDAYRVLVVCQSRPEGIAIPDRCEFLEVSFPPPRWGTADDAERRLFLAYSDRGRKLLRGLERARAFPGSYAMYLDDDDLVSNRLAGFVAKRAGENGWYFDRGYRMDDRHPHVVFWRRRFNEECGSSHVLRSDLAPFPARMDDALDMSDDALRRNVWHANIRSHFARCGTPLDPLPFPGAIYCFHGLNFYATSSYRPEPPWRKMARLAFKTRWITPALRREFGIRSIPFGSAARGQMP